MDTGVAYFLYCDTSVLKDSVSVLEKEGIQVCEEAVPQYLYSQCDVCIKTSISDSFAAESILEENSIYFDSVHKEVSSWY